MRDRDKEEEELEWQRQKRELAKLPLIDRVFGEPPKETVAGFVDGRSKRRLGRYVQFPMRLQLRAKAVVDLIMDRDDYKDRTDLFEVLLEAYLEKHPIDQSQIPPDDVLADRYIEAQKKAEEQRQLKATNKLQRKNHDK
jgi:hypothetical protein